MSETRIAPHAISSANPSHDPGRAPLRVSCMVATHDALARRRLHNLAWHARYHARTGREAIEVERVVTAVRTGHLTVRDAHLALAALRKDQQ